MMLGDGTIAVIRRPVAHRARPGRGDPGRSVLRVGQRGHTETRWLLRSSGQRSRGVAFT